MINPQLPLAIYLPYQIQSLVYFYVDVNPPSVDDFPQIVSNRITRVKPINVGFLSLFVCFFNRRLLVEIIKENI